jgi:hypothetical protein
MWQSTDEGTRVQIEQYTAATQESTAAIRLAMAAPSTVRLARARSGLTSRFGKSMIEKAHVFIGTSCERDLLIQYARCFNSRLQEPASSDDTDNTHVFVERLGLDI